VNAPIDRSSPYSVQRLEAGGRVEETAGLDVAILTGCHDATYAHGLTRALVGQGARVEFVAGDSLDASFLHETASIQFRNLRGSQLESAPIPSKLGRILRYYLRLFAFAARSRAPVFHILWNNKFEFVDRTLLTAWYRACGKRVVMTVHNVNAGRRDGRDGVWNRLSLRLQYRLVQHIFVHTNLMKRELVSDFGVTEDRITVIPFGINDEAPQTTLTGAEARRRLAIDRGAKIVLAFGQIAPYKGLDLLAEIVPALVAAAPDICIVIAGKIKRGHEEYWDAVSARLAPYVGSGRVLLRLGHVPDGEIEVYFKAADCLVLPYREIFQSGLPFLSYAFGLPVISSDAGGLPDEVVEGETGFCFPAEDPDALRTAILKYFSSDLHESLEIRRAAIRRLALARYSWAKVGSASVSIYGRLLGRSQYV